MKTMNWVLLVVGLLVGIGVGSMWPTASAQTIPNVASTSRYQVSAYAYPATPPQIPQHGCYIVDTVTGSLWHAGPDSQGRPLKVSDKLP
ncbi:MAG: hypothetical protein JWP89_775 [Schlesneria sp.]|nr:hypothetical protein [Schlesneria sp.]